MVIKQLAIRVLSQQSGPSGGEDRALQIKLCTSSGSLIPRGACHTRQTRIWIIQERCDKEMPTGISEYDQLSSCTISRTISRMEYKSGSSGEHGGIGSGIKESSLEMTSCSSMQHLRVYTRINTCAATYALCFISGVRKSSVESKHVDEKITGQLPSCFGNLCKLKTLDLSGNNLRQLSLGCNFFGGSIPASIGKLSSLQLLHLSYKEMNGTIPKSIGKLLELVTLLLDNNS